jgi:hypothetical protein
MLGSLGASCVAMCGLRLRYVGLRISARRPSQLLTAQGQPRRPPTASRSQATIRCPGTPAADYLSDRPGRLRVAIERVRDEDAELLDRLSR